MARAHGHVTARDAFGCMCVRPCMRACIDRWVRVRFSDLMHARCGAEDSAPGGTCFIVRSHSLKHPCWDANWQLSGVVRGTGSLRNVLLAAPVAGCCNSGRVG
jgi:hypothetical protein